MPQGDSRHRMLNSAAELFQRNGYHATSWRQIVDHGGAPWGSINFLFPKGKTQLGVEAIAVSAHEVERRVRQVFFDPTDATRCLIAFVDQAAAMLEQSEYERGCPVATVALELAHGTPAIREACIEAFDSWQGTLVELLAPQLGQERAANMARLFLNVYEGALLQARTRQTTEPLADLSAQLPLLVKAVCD
jgi:TetR/AcrR family transcriptional regulator, lmrAB and yxaGH operons repressor